MLAHPLYFVCNSNAISFYMLPNSPYTTNGQAQAA